jgi:hypothetical protein
MKRANASAAVMLLAVALAASPVSAQQRKTVDGVVINIGIVNALAAEHVDAQHGVHQGGHGSGAEHVVVSLADAKTGARIAGADVAIVVKDPKGKTQRKALMAMTTAGVPDYSEVFDFGWSGTYSLRMTVMPKGAAKPVMTRFTVKHYIP